MSTLTGSRRLTFDGRTQQTGKQCFEMPILGPPAQGSKYRLIRMEVITSLVDHDGQAKAKVRLGTLDGGGGNLLVETLVSTLVQGLIWEARILRSSPIVLTVRHDDVVSGAIQIDCYDDIPAGVHDFYG